jgi:hypothetical protein
MTRLKRWALYLLVLQLAGPTLGLVIVDQVWATSWDSAATGNWNLGTTWTVRGGASTGCASSCVAGTDYPGTGDDWKLVSHGVTAPSGTFTVGHSPSVAVAGIGTITSAGNVLTGTGTAWLTDADTTKRLKVGDLINAASGGTDSYCVLTTVSTDTAAVCAANVSTAWTARTYTITQASGVIMNNASAKLTLADGAIMYHRGPIVALTVAGRTNNAAIIGGAGSELYMDATSNTGQMYQIQLGSGDNTPVSIRFIGTTGSHAKIQAYPSGETMQITSSKWTGGGGVHFDYVDLAHLGAYSNTANDCANAGICWTPSSVTTAEFYMHNSTYDDGGQIFNLSSGAAATVDLEGNRFTNSIVRQVMVGASGQAALTTGTRRFVNNYVDRYTNLFFMYGGTVTGNVFADSAEFVQTAPAADVSGNLFITAYSQNFAIGGTPGKTPFSTNYFVNLDQAANTWRGLSLGGIASLGGTQLVSGNVWDPHADMQSPNEIFRPDDSTATITVTIQNDLILAPGYDADIGSVLISSLVGTTDGTDIPVILDHTTLLETSTETGTAAVLDYLGGGELLQLNSITNNIIYSTLATTAYKVGGFTNTSDRTLAAVNAHHNAGYGLDAGTSGKGYDLAFATGTPGASDIDGTAPTWKDTTRRYATYSTHASGLAKAAGTAWDVNHGTYSVGTIVSRTVAGVNGGLPTNYRCIFAHDPIAAAHATYSAPGGPLLATTITTITSGSPVTITKVAHGLTDGARVIIGKPTTADVAGHWTITRVDADNVTLNGSTAALGGGSGGYITQGWLGYWELETTYEMRRTALQEAGHTASATPANLRTFVREGYAVLDTSSHATGDTLGGAMGCCGTYTVPAASGGGGGSRSIGIGINYNGGTYARETMGGIRWIRLDHRPLVYWHLAD